MNKKKTHPSPINLFAVTTSIVALVKIPQTYLGMSKSLSGAGWELLPFIGIMAINFGAVFSTLNFIKASTPIQRRLGFALLLVDLIAVAFFSFAALNINIGELVILTVTMVKIFGNLLYAALGIKEKQHISATNRAF